MVIMMMLMILSSIFLIVLMAIEQIGGDLKTSRKVVAGVLNAIAGVPPYHTIPHHTIPYHIIPYHAMVLNAIATRTKAIWRTDVVITMMVLIIPTPSS